MTCEMSSCLTSKTLSRRENDAVRMEPQQQLEVLTENQQQIIVEEDYE